MPKPNRRAPVTVNKYLAIHKGKMQKLYDEGVIDSDTLVFDFTNDPVVSLIGVVRFGTKVELKIKKFLRIEKRGKIEYLIAKRYSYECHIVGQKGSDIFRYDNYHEDRPHKGHKEPHHLHRFDPPGREVKHSPFEIPEDERPLLDEIIREAKVHSDAYAKQRRK